MQIEGVAGGYGVATFSCRVGLDRSRSGEDDAFGFPAPRITGTPTHEGKAALDAPSFKGFELPADRLVVEKLQRFAVGPVCGRERSEEHTSELQSLMRISYAVFCLKKKK